MHNTCTHTLIHTMCNAQIITGDQLTCKNIRGAKRWVQSEINPVFRLKWANESPGMHVNSNIGNRCPLFLTTCR